MASQTQIAYRDDAEVVWDITERDPALFAELCERVPGLRAQQAAIAQHMPVARTVWPFEGELYRPAFHNRAFYTAAPHADGGVGFVAIKGTEPFAEDLADRYGSLTRRRLHFTVFNAIERYPIEEQTVSMAETLHEATTEAEVALTIQRVYRARYHALPDVPFPLLVVRWPPAVVERFLAGQRPFLSARAMALTERLVASEGLGAYVYYHPDPRPTRILHLGGTLTNELATTEDFSARERALANHGIDVERFMERYLRLAARLLACGFFPGSAPYMKNGFATDPQNVLISGAFVDLGNCVAMRDVVLDHEFYQNWSFALLTLRRTSRALLTDTFMPFWGMHHDDDPLQSLLAGYVWQHFHDVMREEWAVDRSAHDPRLARILDQATPIGGLRESLRCLYQVEQTQGLGTEGRDMPIMFRQKR